MFQTIQSQIAAGTISSEDHDLRPRRKRFAGAIFSTGLLTMVAFVVGILGLFGAF